MNINYLYIDPVTGGMIFTILLGVSGTLYYTGRLILMKLKYKILSGKVTTNTDKIPFVVFAESKNYYNVLNPVCRELANSGKKILYITKSFDDPMLQNKYNNIEVEVIENQYKLFTKLSFIKANVLLSTTPALNVYLWKRSKDVDYYVHIMHGANEIVIYKMFGIDYYDAILLSSAHQEKDVRDLERIRNLPAKELKIVGVPYLDELKKRKELADQNTNKEERKKTVLLAPSWGEAAILMRYGSRIIEALIGTGYNIIIRPHPQSLISEEKIVNYLVNKYKNVSLITWDLSSDNFDSLYNSDIMISDFSGVIFDYTLVFDKPIIYTSLNINYDKRDAGTLGHKMWTESALPRLGVELTEEGINNIKETIDYVLGNTDFSKGRREVKNETWEEEGNGAINVKNYLIEKYNQFSTKNSQ